MKAYGVNELRKMFLEFFEGKGHLKMHSFSLIPHNDKSLLLINSGMAPLKPYFTGAVIPPRKRVATCQKCIRTGDIENVGKTSRHGTFFEMLGNFSFGDYFKREAIAWSWEFLTEVVGLSADRLYPSVYLEDDDAFDIWNKEMGIPKERIFKFGKEDNFWEHGAGPCGPCSEIYYDRGEEYGCDDPNCTVGCECDRYMEVWNNVFTQFDNDGQGNYTELAQKNIDTGMGLERLAVAVQGVESIFDVDTVRSLRDKVCELADKTYKQNEKHDISIRLITDHIRSASFMISDGIMPTNEGRGYVLRRLIRRAARHGHMLGIAPGFLSILAKEVIKGASDGYPELNEKESFLIKVLDMEERKFNKTLEQGLLILEEMISGVKDGVLSGDDAFKLYDTYGFPLELTKEILEEKGLIIDEAGFKQNMDKQRHAARSARAVSNYMGADATVYDLVDTSLATEFVGYDRQENEAVITCIVGKDSLEDSLGERDEGAVIVDATSFYATMGGQEGDRGVIEGENARFIVEDCIKLSGDKVAHIGRVETGMFSVGDKVRLIPDAEGRKETCKNHSATHLLHKALKTVLGSHVEQKGSLVTDTRLRFDFSHFSAMSSEELQKVEEMVNAQIEADTSVDTDVMKLEQAREAGAVALFGEKYSDEVRVVRMGDFSMELCGGTHVARTGEIGSFKIISESGIAAGVRRIEALTGKELKHYYRTLEEQLEEACSSLKCSRENLTDKIAQLLTENKSLHSEIERLKSRNAKAAMGSVDEKVETLGEFSVLITEVADLDMNSLRGLSDELKAKLSNAVLVLASEREGKANLFISVCDLAVEKGLSAGAVIKQAAPLVAGGGGGKPQSAQAGGKNPAGIPDALKKAKELVYEELA